MSTTRNRPATRGERTRVRPERRSAHRPIIGSGVAPAAPVIPSGRRWARDYRTRLIATDWAIIIATVLAAQLARFGTGDAAVDAGSVQLDYGIVSVVVVAAWIAVLGAFRTRDARIVGVGVAEYKRVVNASAITFGALAVGFLLLKVDIARGYVVLAFPLGVVALLVARWSWRRWLLRRRMQGAHLSRVVVVGSRADVEDVSAQILLRPASGYAVVGVAIDEHVDGLEVAGRTIPVVSDLGSVAAAAARTAADAVIVASQPRAGSNAVRTLGWELEGSSIELVLASRLTDVAGPRIHFRPVEGLPLIHVEIPQFEGGKHVMKRALDIAVSGLALVVLAPVMLLLAVVVRLDSPGGAIFRQERVGKAGEGFHMLKFRSMRVTAEAELAALAAANEGSGPLFKMRRDPRVTRVGAVLRRYSLDELPQLWNILVGDMSLVGPRPPLRTEVQGYESHVHRRLFIKPGLTGMWQVNGRSDLSWDESVRLDLYYVENWSLTGDVMIMWRTFRVLTRPVGAY
ncbi:sugar transferase [Clavibacter capsici]|uniref:sugar transferase n=1 Tax=Clavibacter capsici TaxID=1874630 RepID=UPI00287BB1BE|nr:sugar transferase [Clavibacter capsici]